jgi:hypothetical protein
MLALIKKNKTVMPLGPILYSINLQQSFTTAVIDTQQHF